MVNSGINELFHTLYSAGHSCWFQRFLLLDECLPISNLYQYWNRVDYRRFQKLMSTILLPHCFVVPCVCICKLVAGPTRQHKNTAQHTCLCCWCWRNVAFYVKHLEIFTKRMPFYSWNEFPSFLHTQTQQNLPWACSFRHFSFHYAIKITNWTWTL